MSPIISLARKAFLGPLLSAYLDGIPGAAQRRCVTEIDVVQIFDSQVAVYGGGKDIDPL